MLGYRVETGNKVSEVPPYVTGNAAIFFCPHSDTGAAERSKKWGGGGGGGAEAAGRNEWGGGIGVFDKE